MEIYEPGTIVLPTFAETPAMIIARDPQRNKYSIRWLKDYGYDYPTVHVRADTLIPFDLDKLINDVIND